MSFTDLITLEHKDCRKFSKTVEFSTAGYQGLIDLCHRAYELYDIDNAKGEQLDAVAKWIGIPREIRLDVFKFFSWDIDLLGWEEAEWWTEDDSRYILHSLTDPVYRRMLKNRILSAHFDGTLPCAVAILRDALAEEVHKFKIEVQEELMKVTFNITGGISDVNKMILRTGMLGIKPGGVFVDYKFGDEK